jgi:hypothetical protein
MTRSFSLAAALLAVTVGFGLPAGAAAPTDRDAASEAPAAAGRTNSRAWPMTISMGYGSDSRCAIVGCAGDAVSEDTVVRTRTRVSMGYGSDIRCAIVGCAGDAVSEDTVARTRARISMGYGSDQRCRLEACADAGTLTRPRVRPVTVAMGAGSDRRCALAEAPAVCGRG